MTLQKEYFVNLHFFQEQTWQKTCLGNSSTKGLQRQGVQNKKNVISNKTPPHPRALSCSLSDEDIVQPPRTASAHLPNGIPFVYELDQVSPSPSPSPSPPAGPEASEVDAVPWGLGDREGGRRGRGGSGKSQGDRLKGRKGPGQGYLH